VVIYRISYPHIAVLGRVPNTSEFRNIKRFNDMETDERLFVLRFDSQLYFANAQYFRDFINKELATKPAVKAVVLHAGPIHAVDSSAMHVLQDVISDLRSHNIELHIAEAKGPLRDKLARTGLTDVIGQDHFHLSVDAAVNAALAEETNIDPYAVQDNFNGSASASG